MRGLIEIYDHWIIQYLYRISPGLARFALFVVFFWFGILKVIGNSPANDLVGMLLTETLPFFPFAQFIIGFGLFEMAIGILFIIPRAERAAIGFLILHMITTALPIFILPSVAWQAFLIPTLEGQYIIKNLVIVALALGMASNLKPLQRKF